MLKLISKAILIFIISLTLFSCKETIVHDLSEQEVNNLLTVLSNVGLSADRTRQADGKWSLGVDNSEKILALKFLQEKRLFKKSLRTPVKQKGLMTSREDQRFYYERNLSAEIENTLLSIEGVLEARIHMNLPARDPLFGHKTEKNSKGTASVLLIAFKGCELNKKDIANLVSGASGISVEEISVMVHRQAKIENNLAKSLEDNIEGVFLGASNFNLFNSKSLILSILAILIIIVFYIVKRIFLRKSRLKKFESLFQGQGVNA